eukprot:523008-Prymnesium_polylepis.1
MRSTEASVRMAKSMKMVSMQRAEMWSQSMKPRAYAIGSHMRSIEPGEGWQSERAAKCEELGVEQEPGVGRWGVGALVRVAMVSGGRCEELRCEELQELVDEAAGGGRVAGTHRASRPCP